MQTASETRRTRLEMLIKKYESIAALNAALGWARTDPKLTQIRNANTRSGKTKPYQMGDSMAREIEDKLALERGWMDTPPTHTELHGGQDQREMMIELMNSLPPEDLATALRMLGALKEPAVILKNGTEH